VAEPKSPRERAEGAVRDLAKRGESRARDLQKTARDLADRSTRSRREFVGLIQKEIRRQIRGLGLATREDIEKLQRRIRQLEKGKPTRRAAPSRAKRGSQRSTKSSGR
jgi:polyhydroxyalkanoate synthesis regulator phasin